MMEKAESGLDIHQGTSLLKHIIDFDAVLCDV
jgi:hypothetical protein